MIWLRLESNFALDPRHGRLARRLGVPRAEAVCHVVSAMCWTAQFHETGDLAAVPPEELAEGANWTGDPGDFVHALHEAGWLTAGAKSPRSWADWIERQQPLLNARERLRRHREGQHAQQLGVRPARAEGETFQKRSENASETVTSQPASRSTPPLPPARGGPERAARRNQTADLLALGAHRPTPPPDAAEQPEQDLRMRDAYRSAAERAAAAGDLDRAAELTAAADRMDRQFEETAARRGAGGKR